MTSSDYGAGVLACGFGAVTSVGRTALASAAAVRAGVSGFVQHSFMVDSAGEPLSVAECPWLAGNPNVANRISDCLVAAVRESLGPLYAARRDGRGPVAMLFVNLPSQRPGLPEYLVTSVRTTLEQAFSGVFARIELMELGHAGSLVALHSAVQILARDPSVACVIAGADSYLDPDMLEWLEDTDQLHGAGARKNAWGFIPGEGAGSILLVSGRVAERAAIKPRGCVASVAVGHEANVARSGTVCLGHGLTTAFRGVFSELPNHLQVTDIYCDMNGAPYRADEFAFAVIRTRERFVSATDFIAPADCWGDVGAASGPLAIALACIAAVKGYSKGSTGLVWASSETGERAAAVIDTTGCRR